MTDGRQAWDTAPVQRVHNVAWTLLYPQDTDPYGPGVLTEAWLLEQTPGNRRGYYQHLFSYLGFLRQRGTHPSTARPTDVGQWRTALAETYAASTVARHLAAVSSWYRYLLDNTAAGFTTNPVAVSRRPKVSRESPTVGLTPAEVTAILHTAAAGGPRRLRNHALLLLLATTGLRVGEALRLNRGDYRRQAGYTVIRYTAKGGITRVRPLDGSVAHAIDTYLAQRDIAGVETSAGEPLFATERPADPGPYERMAILGRLDQPAVFRLLRTTAQAAGIDSWKLISPHSLRHFFATYSLQLGATLTDVQDAMGHADPRTTRSYDRARHNLAADSSLTVGRALQNFPAASPSGTVSA